MPVADGWQLLASGGLALVGAWLVGHWFEARWMPRRLSDRVRGASVAFAAAALERAAEVGEYQEAAERTVKELGRRLGWSRSREQRVSCTLRLFWTGLASMGDEELVRWRRSLAVATPREAWGPVAAAAWRALEPCVSFPLNRKALRAAADGWLFGGPVDGEAAVVRLALDYALLQSQLGPLDAYAVLRRTQAVADARMLRQLGRIVTDSALRGNDGSEQPGKPAAEPRLA
ncbi:MAG: hypothetical protein N2109_05800 [Fimbriimonadales bacterium]|nr:hypothetical protein [Fimbriimonadales bacterium]